MKLNWAERWVVNNPIRILVQKGQIRWMADSFPGERPRIILEVGAGRAAAAPLIMKRFEPDLMVTTDLDPEMLERGRSILSPADLRRANLCAADSISLPFRDGAVDAVFGFGIIHHVPDWRAALAELARVLKPGGTYFLEEIYPGLYQNAFTKHFLLHPTFDRFKRNDLRTALADLGFRIVAVKELKRFHILAVLRKGDA